MAGPRVPSVLRRSGILWFALTMLSAVGFGATMAVPKLESKTLFLPGRTSDGHYQIELDCEACHTSGFASSETLESACLSCHADELAESKDSHPKSKFTDPRNAKRIAELDARSCLTCHIEHAPARTGAMGLSLPPDYCHRCHQDISSERPSHQGLAFDSCAEAGCHNYHDNRALYEDYLVKHAGEPRTLAEPIATLVPQGSCPAPERATLSATTNTESCGSCHAAQVGTFSAGKHGMRAARGLGNMKPGDARLTMKGSAGPRELSCASCHRTSGEDELFTEVRACQGCHDDSHTRAYENSKHYELTVRAFRGEIAKAGAVTCATCHMPAVEDDSGVANTNHNQNHNLRPSEKMIRSACSKCHGLGFSIDSLADADLTRENFSGQPGSHVVSIDWALKRDH